MATTQSLRLSWPEHVAQGAEFAEGTDELDVTFLVDHDAEIRQIILSKPASSGASALLTSGESLLTALPVGASAELLDQTAITDTASVLFGAGRILQREGRGKLRVQTTGGIDGEKRVCLLLSPLKRSG